MPIIVILQSVSPNGRFIGLSLLTSTFPLSTMGLILVPKMLTIRRAKLGALVGDKRGSRQGTRVSGLNTGASETVARPHDNGNSTMAEARESHIDNDHGTRNTGFNSPRVQTVIIL